MSPGFRAYPWARAVRSHATDDVRTVLGLEVDEIERNTCRVCETIKVMVNRDTGFCSERCRKGSG